MTDVLDKGISVVLRCPGNLRADSPITIDAYLPESMASAALYQRTGAHVPLLETFVRDFAMIHLASLRDCHDASSFPVPNAINLQTTPCRYQFKCETSGTANDEFHISLNELTSILQDFAVCLPSPVSTVC